MPSQIFAGGAPFGHDGGGPNPARPYAVLIQAKGLSELATRWRAKARELRRVEAGGQAAALSVAADDLEAMIACAGEELLSLTSAARESGYSADHLGRAVRRGTIANAGRENAPKIRRADVPLKTGNLRQPLTDPTVSLPRQQIARAVANRRLGGG